MRAFKIMFVRQSNTPVYDEYICSDYMSLTADNYCCLDNNIFDCIWMICNIWFLSYFIVQYLYQTELPCTIYCMMYAA